MGFFSFFFFAESKVGLRKSLNVAWDHWWESNLDRYKAYLPKWFVH